MIDQRLYIDGVLMDLSESTDVVLDIKSNLFRDVTKMTSNYTYTIQGRTIERNEHRGKHRSLNLLGYNASVHEATGERNETERTGSDRQSDF